MKHLAIFKGGGAEKILSGKKTIESRFSKSKIVPFGAVSSGDLVFIKPSGGQIIGQFRVIKVIYMDGLTKEDIEEIKGKYGKEIATDEAYWKGKNNAKYATLIFIGNSSRFITSPIKPIKKDLRGWMVLGVN